MTAPQTSAGQRAPAPDRRAKIVATIGPASSSDEMLCRLMGAGVDVVRINGSYGEPHEHGAIVAAVGRAAEGCDRSVAALIDLQGPKIRLGVIEGEPELLEGSLVRLLDEGTEPTDEAHCLPTTYAGLSGDIEAGHRILIGDGLVELVAERVAAGHVEARVVEGGAVRTGRGVNLPDTAVSAPVLDADDRATLVAALEAGVDLVALSFVRSGADAEVIRSVMRTVTGRLVPIIAKIERASAIDDIEGILTAFDGVMVARGDLGVEIDLAEVPAAQKRIIAAARRAAKPVIVATEMLESMIHAPRPTRAEASDVVNAILDGADAVMLSAETAIGDHPVTAVETMSHLVSVAERSGAIDPLPTIADDIDDAFVRAAVRLAAASPEMVIGVVTRSGSTARRVSSLRPPNRIVVLTPGGPAEPWSLLWGVESEPGTATELADADRLRSELVGEFDIADHTPVLVLSGTDPGRSNLLLRLDP